MRRKTLVSILGSMAAALGLVALGTTSASAHGERAQEGFVRMEAVSWWDVKFSEQTLNQGDTMTITGTAKILETWPINMSGGNPEVCYFTIVEPGSRFVLIDRTINGVATPQSNFCHKGGVYNFADMEGPCQGWRGLVLTLPPTPSGRLWSGGPSSHLRPSGCRGPARAASPHARHIRHGSGARGAPPQAGACLDHRGRERRELSVEAIAERSWRR
jgi:Monooxygenase subunit B protein